MYNSENRPDRVSLDELAEALNSIPERHFSFETVTDCLRTHPVAESALEPYKYFQAPQPTANVILKNDLFELIVMSWEVAQKTAVQGYPDSRTWGLTCMGRLQLRTFRVKAEKENSCEVEETDVCEIKDAIVAISPDEPMHQWTNCLEYGQRAMSLHVFSPPVRTVRVYARNNFRVHRVNYEMREGRMVWRVN